MSRFNTFIAIIIILCAALLVSCESDGDNMVIVSHEEQVEVLTEAELYKVDNDSIRHDSLKTELRNGIDDPDSFKRPTHKMSSDLANGN